MVFFHEKVKKGHFWVFSKYDRIYLVNFSLKLGSLFGLFEGYKAWAVVEIT
jgi:hypothetical protein